VWCKENKKTAIYAWPFNTSEHKIEAAVASIPSNAATNLGRTSTNIWDRVNPHAIKHGVRSEQGEGISLEIHLRSSCFKNCWYCSTELNSSHFCALVRKEVNGSHILRDEPRRKKSRSQSDSTRAVAPVIVVVKYEAKAGFMPRIWLRFIITGSSLQYVRINNSYNWGKTAISKTGTLFRCPDIQKEWHDF